MKIQSIIFAVLLMCSTQLDAQELQVKSFSLAQNDISAQTFPRTDNNGYNCALVKVGFGQQGCQFEGGIMGSVENKTGEYWVFMPQGNRQLKVKHPNFSPLMVTFADYGIDKLESNRTYVLTVIAPSMTTVKQTLNIKVTPANATVIIDGDVVEEKQVMLSTGSHTYNVAAKGYYPQSGDVKVTANAPAKLIIELDRKKSAASQSSKIASNQSSTVSQSVQSSIEVPVNSISNSTNPLTFTVNGVTFEMVPVQGGTFTMGATSEQGSGAWDDEKPVHQVTLNSYYIGKYEVTQALWKAVTGSNPSSEKGDNLPVEDVDWDDCQSFIRELNRKTGKKFRLPTEAEWEFACRGGCKSAGYKYSGSDNQNEVAWCTNKNKLYKVGKRKPNELGIYDMSGNVWEWCQDWYGKYSSNSQVNPSGPSIGSEHVVRGGNMFYINGIGCRSSDRGSHGGAVRRGLRIVLSEV